MRFCLPRYPAIQRCRIQRSPLLTVPPSFHRERGGKSWELDCGCSWFLSGFYLSLYGRLRPIPASLKIDKRAASVRMLSFHPAQAAHGMFSFIPSGTVRVLSGRGDGTRPRAIAFRTSLSRKVVD